LGSEELDGLRRAESQRQVLLWLIERGEPSSSQEIADALGLSVNAVNLSYITFRGGHLKPSQIADGTNMKPSTVRARLAEMKDKGLVKQSPAGYASAVNPYDILMKLYRDIKKQ
jgi:DNA-binding IclR family transcriptional regulator